MLISLENLEKEHRISRIQLIREEIEIEILNSLVQEPWSKHVAFYGGTSLRLAYGSPRFSEDIDLFMLKKFDFADFADWVKRLPQSLTNVTTVQDLHLKRKTFFALLMISHRESKHALPLKIELFRNIEKYPIPTTELRLIKTPLSPLSPLIMVASLEALQGMKEDALRERSSPRDFYDLWFIHQLLRKPFQIPKKLPRYQKRLFVNELQVYLPKNHYPIIDQLWKIYESAH